MALVEETREVEQDEGELERPPRRFGLLSGCSSVGLGTAPAGGPREGVVHGREGEPGLLLGGQQRDAGLDPPLSPVHSLHQGAGRLLAAWARNARD